MPRRAARPPLGDARPGPPMLLVLSLPGGERTGPARSAPPAKAGTYPSRRRDARRQSTQTESQLEYIEMPLVISPCTRLFHTCV